MFNTPTARSYEEPLSLLLSQHQLHLAVSESLLLEIFLTLITQDTVRASRSGQIGKGGVIPCADI
jgi:hypothetical protein